MPRFLLYHDPSESYFIETDAEEARKAMAADDVIDVTDRFEHELKASQFFVEEKVRMEAQAKMPSNDTSVEALRVRGIEPDEVLPPPVKSNIDRFNDALANLHSIAGSRQKPYQSKLDFGALLRGEVKARPSDDGDPEPLAFKAINYIPEEKPGIGEIVVDVGDGMGVCMPKVVTEDVLEAIKAKAIRNATALGMQTGIYPLYQVVTPKGRNIKFPFPTPRPGQLEAVDECIDIIQSGNDCMLEAGTGVGKSPIAVAVATFFKDSWLLVGRNDLIDQWQSDFEKFSDMGFYKSRNRFLCVNAPAQSDGSRPTCADKRACKEGTKIKEGLVEAWEQANEKFNLGQGPDPGRQPQGPGVCPYGVNRDLALAKDHTAMTLALGLTMFKYLGNKHPMVKPRALLVVDECSELESELMGFHSCTISIKTLRRALGRKTWEDLECEIPPPVMRENNHIPYTAFPAPEADTPILDYLKGFKPDTWGEAALWGILAKNALQTRLKAIQEEIEGEKGGFAKELAQATAAGNYAQIKQVNDAINKMTGDNVEIEEKVSDILRQVEMAFEAAAGDLPYCHEIKESFKGPTDEWQLILKPLEARGLVDRLLATFGCRILFVSATTGTPQNFINTHALKRPIKKVTIPSPFPVDHRPVVFKPAGNLGAKTIVRDLPKVHEAIYNIVTRSGDRFSDHRNQRGIIHTFTTKISDSVYDFLSARGQGSRLFLLKGGGRQREQTMADFLACPNGILISPSAMLGLSMDDDKARYQIIAKVPYAFLGDKSVKYRMDNIPDWYSWQTAKDLIQTFGRVVRSMDDWGYTYILDEGFHRFYNQNQLMFPSYVRSAIHGI